jgi:hypothetical protein
MRIRDFACGQRLPVHRANYFAIFMCWLSRNYGWESPTSWTPVVLFSAVQGKFYLFYFAVVSVP